MVRRRDFLLGTLAACGGRTVAPTPTVARRPFTLVDTMPTFFAFWDRAEHSPLDAQVARFRAEVMAVHPAIYDARVLGVHGDDPEAALRDRLAGWLAKLPPIVPRMRALHAHFERDIDAGVQRFTSVLPSFRWNGTCYLWASVDTMNGGMRDVGSRGALMFGLDVIARDTTAMPPPVLFAHELFHAHHGDVLPASTEKHLYDALWAEGLATHASQIICAGATDRQALPPSHLHDPAHPALDIPDRRVWLDEIMPKYATELGGELLDVLDSQRDDDYAKFFLGRAAPALGERPVRSAYWFGLHVARALARERSLDALSRLPVATLRPQIADALAALRK